MVEIIHALTILLLVIIAGITSVMLGIGTYKDEIIEVIRAFKRKL